MSGATIELRPACPDDAAAIAATIRAGFAPPILELFTYGCVGIERYIRGQIAAESAGCDTTYHVAVTGDRMLGATEMRVSPDGLFLNYVAVTPEARSARLGTRLLRAAVERAARPAHRRIGLDVLEHNLVALSWYDVLGFTCVATTEWFTLPLPPSAGEPPGGVAGAAQAAVCHEAFGFSRIIVRTAAASHEVGLLGARWFRITDRDALDDPSLAAALRALDPGRQLLALLPDGAISPGFLGARRVSAMRRLTCDIDVLRIRLADRAA